jgi:hypothetical protein
MVDACHGHYYWLCLFILEGGVAHLYRRFVSMSSRYLITWIYLYTSGLKKKKSSFKLKMTIADIWRWCNITYINKYLSFLNSAFLMRNVSTSCWSCSPCCSSMVANCWVKSETAVGHARSCCPTFHVGVCIQPRIYISSTAECVKQWRKKRKKRNQTKVLIYTVHRAQNTIQYT